MLREPVVRLGAAGVGQCWIAGRSSAKPVPAGILQYLYKVLFANPVGQEPALKMQVLDQGSASVNKTIFLRQPRIHQDRAAERGSFGQHLRHRPADRIQKKCRMQSFRHLPHLLGKIRLAAVQDIFSAPAAQQLHLFLSPHHMDDRQGRGAFPSAAACRPAR